MTDLTPERLAAVWELHDKMRADRDAARAEVALWEEKYQNAEQTVAELEQEREADPYFRQLQGTRVQLEAAHADALAARGEARTMRMLVERYRHSNQSHGSECLAIDAGPLAGCDERCHICIDADDALARPAMHGEKP